ncbi:MAG TPA: acyl-CoA dehydrogenase family protein, partial [Actinoplanes sp.]|nr:acyl-CoA dehydrogenase family protein [Actinoplanes sp.]
MTIDRILPTDEAYELLGLTKEIADGELAPRASDYEARGEFPRQVLRTVGRAGLLGLPYPEADGGGGQPYEVYLQVLEVLAGSWLAIAEAVSVHTLSCFPVAGYGSERQRKQLPDMLAGDLLG